MTIPSNRELNRFSFYLSIFLSGIEAYYFFSKNTVLIWPIASVIFLLLSMLVYPKLSIVLYIPAMASSRILGKINSILLLSILYVIVFTLYHIFFRISGYDPLQQRKKSSYWISRPEGPIDLTRAF